MPQAATMRWSAWDPGAVRPAIPYCTGIDYFRIACDRPATRW